jgi:hypothetical protein
MVPSLVGPEYCRPTPTIRSPAFHEPLKRLAWESPVYPVPFPTALSPSREPTTD